MIPAERRRSCNRTTAQWTTSLSPDAKHTGSRATREAQCRTVDLKDWLPTHRKLMIRRTILWRMDSLAESTTCKDLIMFGVAQIRGLYKSLMANSWINAAAQYTRSLSSKNNNNNNNNNNGDYHAVITIYLFRRDKNEFKINMFQSLKHVYSGHNCVYSKLHVPRALPAWLPPHSTLLKCTPIYLPTIF